MPVSLCEWRVRIGTFVHWISDYEIKERKERLLKERIRRMKVLCERLKAKMDDSEQDSGEDDKGESGEDGSGPMKRKQCPHKTTNIQSLGDSYIKDLLTCCDQCIHDLLTTSHCCITDLLTPADGYLRKLLKPCDNGVMDMITPDYHSVKDLLRSGDYNVKDLITPEDCSVKDLITPEHCSVKDLITQEDCSVKDLIMPEGCSIRDLIISEDCSVKDLITIKDCSVKDLITPEDCSVKDLITLEDCRVRDLITPEDCSIKDLITPEECSVKDNITPEDCSVKDLIMPEDCSVRDLIALEDCRVKDLITPEHDSVKYLISPDNSQVKGVFGQNVPEFNFSCTLSQIRPCSKELKKSNDKSVNVLHTATDENIELVASFVESNGESVTESCSRHHHALSDTSFKEHLSTNKSLTCNKLNNIVNAGVNSYSREKQSLSQCSVKEQLISSCLETDIGLSPRLKQSDHLSVGLLESAVSVGEDLLQLSDLCIHKPLRSGDSLINDNRKTCEPYTSGKEQHPGPGTFTNERPIRTNAVFEDLVSSESYKQFQTSTDTPVEEKSSVMVPHSSRLYCNSEQHGKANPNGTSTPLCPGLSLKSKTSLIPEEIPPVAELLLLRSGDVELNPGPRQGPGWSLDLERELKSLVDEISPEYYTVLCNSLGFGRAQSQSILSKNLFDVPKSLFEIICSWGVKQRDGTNYNEVLADKLRSVHLDALGRKLLQGGYRMTEPPASADLDPQDTPQPLKDMTEEQVIKCGEDLKTFYLEEICKIKPDPLDFTSVLEFERIYTNLTLLNSKSPLDYTELLTTKVNGVLPKRLMVEGEGGVGKTTLCSKIAWDWANGSPQFQQFSWVLVIPLRKVIKGQTVGDIVKNYLSDSNSVTPAQIDNYIRSKPTKVLIVLDGLDEYDGDLLYQEDSDISQILRRRKFKECTVLVTTRPWRADQIKCNGDLSRAYAFIAVKGFSSRNVSSYIKKYFVDDAKAGSDLIRFIEVNDIIRENMAPFPINVARLCTLWETYDVERREAIRKLKTFSQFFDQMVMLLKDHYASKITEVLREADLEKEMEYINSCLLEIGPIAFRGLLTKKLTFTEEDFISCKKAMETCCRVGVLSRENQNISKWKRTSNTRQSVTTSIFFPHKLFQEYIAALHLDFLFNTDRQQYNSSLDKIIIGDAQEFRYLLYFTAAQGQEIGLDIVNKIQNEARNYYDPYLNEPLDWNAELDYAEYPPTDSYRGYYSHPFPRRGEKAHKRKGHYDFLVDVTFEAYNKDTAKSIGRRIFAEEKILTIDEDMPTHTLSGYLFIMEQHGMETLIFRGRSCGPTVSRDLADFLCSSSSLSRLEFHRTTLDEDFYRLLQDRGSSALAELYVDSRFLGELHSFHVTIRDLFPSLQHLGLTTLQTVTPGFIERLTHPNLSVLSIKADSTRQTSYRDVKEGEELSVPLIDEPASLGQIFSSSFPELTNLSFSGLVIGNIRCEAILRSLRNHKNMKSTSFTGCFTDDELDYLAKEISNESGITISLKHDKAQQRLRFGYSENRLTPDLMHAFCHGTCVRTLAVLGRGLVRSRGWFPDLQGREVHSKICTFVVASLQLNDDQSASCCLGKFICLLPCLTDLRITSCSFHDEFYKEIADRPSSSKIQNFTVKYLDLCDDQSASCCLGRFICLLPCLTDLRILLCSFHDEFYKEIVDRASYFKIRTLVMSYPYGFGVIIGQSASKQLARFLCSLPCLTDLTLEGCDPHDDFYTELTSLAASSQNPYFRNNKHMGMLREWSARKERRQQQLTKQRLQTMIPAYRHIPRSWEQLGPNILQPSDRPSTSGPLRSAENNRTRDSETEVIDQTGGTISVKGWGITMRFPPGAVKSPVAITLKAMDNPPELDFEADEILATCGFQCSPGGLQLHKPAIVTLPHSVRFSRRTHMQTLLYKLEKQEGKQVYKIYLLRSGTTPSCKIEKDTLILSIQHFCGFWSFFRRGLGLKQASPLTKCYYVVPFEKIMPGSEVFIKVLFHGKNHRDIKEVLADEGLEGFKKQEVESEFLCNEGGGDVEVTLAPVEMNLKNQKLQILPKKSLLQNNSKMTYFSLGLGEMLPETIKMPIMRLTVRQRSGVDQVTENGSHEYISESDVEMQFVSSIADSQERTFPRTKNDFDDKLEKVASEVVSGADIDKLGKELGYTPSQIANYIATNNKTQNVTSDGTKQMLRDWRKRQTRRDEKKNLKAALQNAGQIHLADDLFPRNDEASTSAVRRHSVGMKPMYEYDDGPDRPSTSGLSSAGISTGPSPWEGERIPSHRKRIHSDSDGDCDDNFGVGVGGNEDDGGVGVGGNEDDGGVGVGGNENDGSDNGNTSTTAENLERRPRKRRAKTDRKYPASP